MRRNDSCRGAKERRLFGRKGSRRGAKERRLLPFRVVRQALLHAESTSYLLKAPKRLYLPICPIAAVSK